MFNFLKKKKINTVETEVVEILTGAQKNDIQKKIDRMTLEINETQLEDTVLAEKYENIGLLFVQLNETDQAIIFLEKSQGLKNSIGTGYKKLMSLYNQKRAEAAKNGDDAGIDQWMNKMDEMRQIAKKVTISGQ